MTGDGIELVSTFHPGSIETIEIDLPLNYNRTEDWQWIDLTDEERDMVAVCLGLQRSDHKSAAFAFSAVQTAMRGIRNNRLREAL